GKRHILTKKSSKKKRQLKNPAVTADGFAKLYKRLMGAA
ncbi:MAG: 50S ribosomal protein L35, partial [Simkaniaceae bacterium]|nr:50S ribosomal protein L35 [Simkaniaceae bacterium]